MSFQPQTSDEAEQICPKLLEEIANDDELKNLTQEELETIFGGGIVPIIPTPMPTYGHPRLRSDIK